MDKELIEIGKGEKYFFYLDRKGNGSIIDFKCELETEVKPDILCKATEDAVRSFPLFALRPYITKDGNIYLIKNDLPIEVYPEIGECMALGSEDVKGYLFRVLYKDNSIFLHAHHSLGDGRTIVSFMQTVAYYYLVHLGVEIDTEGLIVTKEQVDDPTLMDEFLEAANAAEIDEPKGAYFPENVFDVTESLGDTEFSFFLCDIQWDQSELVERIHELEVTPVPFIAAVVGESINRCDLVGNKHIVAGVPVDMRAKMGSHSQRNYIGNIRLPYYPEYRDLSFEDCVKKLAADLKQQIYLPNIVTRVRQLKTIVEKMIGEPLIKEKVAVDTEVKPEKRSGATAQTYLLTNVGRVKLPKNMQPHIKNFCAEPANGRSLALEMVSYGNIGSIIMSDPKNNSELSDMIITVLGEQGVHANRKPVSLNQCDKIEIKLFMKEM